MAEFASKGVAGAGLGTGIAGLSLGVLNAMGGCGLLGGLFNGNGCCSENTAVNRYELGLTQDIAAKDARMKKCCKSVFHIWTSFICRRAAGALK